MELRRAALAAMIFVALIPTDPAAAKYEGVRRIGVVSAIGDTFAVQKIGFTVFGNEHNQFAIEPWKIDDYVVGRIRATLAGRFDVRAVSVPKAAIVASGGSAGKIAEALRQASPQGFDAYVVVTRWASPYGTTNQRIAGLGIIDASGGFVGTNVTVFTLYAITVIDGHQFTSLGAAVAPSPGFFVTVHGPSRAVDKDWLPTALDANANPRLKAAVVELLAQSLPSTLQKLELTK
ncbi:MAG TPA: hypothetical protein VLX44_02980 [Xanthobacteraceae bacterium]|nr:hypothetical protein [Xanthobacteraceae bacterium]